MTPIKVEIGKSMLSKSGIKKKINLKKVVMGNPLNNTKSIKRSDCVNQIENVRINVIKNVEIMICLNRYFIHAAIIRNLSHSLGIYSILIHLEMDVAYLYIFS